MFDEPACKTRLTKRIHRSVVSQTRTIATDNNERIRALQAPIDEISSTINKSALGETTPCHVLCTEHLLEAEAMLPVSYTHLTLPTKRIV